MATHHKFLYFFPLNYRKIIFSKKMKNLLVLLSLLLALPCASCQFPSFTVPIGPGFGDPRFVWTYDTRVIYSPVTSISTVTSSFGTSISWTRINTITNQSTTLVGTLSQTSVIGSSFFPVATAFAFVPVTADAQSVQSGAFLISLLLLGSFLL